MTETVVDLVRRRGDTYPITLFVVDTEGDAVDVTGYSFKLTADPSAEPTADTNNIFQLTGSITDAAGGEVTFSPTATDTDEIGEYFYDVEMTDGDGVITTLATGKLTLLQDITKPAA